VQRERERERESRVGVRGGVDAYVVVFADLRGVDAPFQLHNVLSLQQIVVLWQVASINTTSTKQSLTSPLLTHCTVRKSLHVLTETESQTTPLTTAQDEWDDAYYCPETFICSANVFSNRLLLRRADSTLRVRRMQNLCPTDACTIVLFVTQYVANSILFYGTILWRCLYRRSDEYRRQRSKMRAPMSFCTSLTASLSCFAIAWPRSDSTLKLFVRVGKMRNATTVTFSADDLHCTAYINTL